MQGFKLWSIGSSANTLTYKLPVLLTQLMRKSTKKLNLHDRCFVLFLNLHGHNACSVLNLFQAY